MKLQPIEIRRAIYEFEFSRFRTTVRLGEHDTTIETEAVTYDIPVVKTVKFPTYDTKDGNGDLAILYLEHDVEISRKHLQGLNLFYS